MVISTPNCNSGGDGIKRDTLMRVFKGACEYFLKQGFDRFEAERYAQACLRQLRRGVRSRSQEQVAEYVLSKPNLEYVIYATGDVL